HAELLALLRAQRPGEALQYHASETDDGVQGGAQLVRHGREKRGLDLICRLRALPCRLEIPRALCDLCFEACVQFEQRLRGLLALGDVDGQHEYALGHGLYPDVEPPRMSIGKSELDLGLQGNLLS